MIPLILFWMGLLGRANPELASAIDATVKEEGCLYAWKDCERRSAALLVVVAYRESNFKVDAIGDHGRSVCAFQILNGPRALLSDVRGCVRTGFRMLKDSLATCKGSIAGYARGNCESPSGKRIDADRKNLTSWVLGKSK